MKKQLNLILIISIGFMTTSCSSIHNQVDKDVEDSQAAYKVSAQATEAAILQKKKDSYRTIHIDLEAINKKIDESER